MPIPREQLRLDPADLDDLLAGTRTAHVATVSAAGAPHVVPLWFVWHDGALWINNLRRSRRSSDLAAGSPVAVCVDDGVEYADLRGVVLYGTFAEPGDDPALPGARAAFAAKYWGGAEVPDLKSHVWLVLRPDRLVSWDFAKIPAGRDRRLEATREEH